MQRNEHGEMAYQDHIQDLRERGRRQDEIYWAEREEQERVWAEEDAALARAMEEEGRLARDRHAAHIAEMDRLCAGAADPGVLLFWLMLGGLLVVTVLS